MDTPVLHAGFLKGFLLCLFGGTCLLTSSGCQSTSPAAPRRPEKPTEIRSELVLLNIPEASGWVAYHCTPSEEPEMEDYRVVVIRQQTGTIIYDSQIPLAVDLCTHGFEMAPDDQRLQHLARTVDSSIIEPLEAFRRSQPAATPTPAPTESDSTSSDTTTKPEVEHEMSEAVATVPSESTLKTRTQVESEKPFGLGAYENGILHITLQEAGSLAEGDRLFVRNSPQIITLPGTEEQILVSEGEVVGLVEVISTDNLTASARLLNGEIPENSHLEKTE